MEEISEDISTGNKTEYCEGKGEALNGDTRMAFL